VRVDSEDAPSVAVINEAMAAALWPDQDPLGKRFERVSDEARDRVEVVGVVPNGKYFWFSCRFGGSDLGERLRPMDAAAIVENAGSRGDRGVWG